MLHYAKVATTVKDWIDVMKPKQSNEPITDPVLAASSILSCEVCQGTMKAAQALLRDDGAQTILMNLLDDVCRFGGNVISLSACQLYIQQSVPSIMDNLAGLMVSAEYSC